MIGDALDAEPSMRIHRRKIIRHQNRLRKLVTPEAWAVYLDLEAATAGRLNDAVDLVATWAFRQGARRPR